MKILGSLLGEPRGSRFQADTPGRCGRATHSPHLDRAYWPETGWAGPVEHVHRWFLGTGLRGCPEWPKRPKRGNGVLLALEGTLQKEAALARKPPQWKAPKMSCRGGDKGLGVG